MNLYAAFSLFSLTILLYWIMSEFFTMMFRFTGLPSERARFQVTSLLTGCGFTTKESESFLSTRARRRLARITMLFGYVFNITIVSAFINVFLSSKEAQIKSFILGILMPLSVVALIFVFMRVPAVRSWGDRMMETLAGKIAYGSVVNSAMVIDSIGNGSIVQVYLHFIPEQYRGLSLAESRLKSEQNILVMLVEHKGKPPVPADADTVFEEGDKLTVFGNYSVIRKAFNARERFNEPAEEQQK